MARITINGISLDPERHAAALRSASLESEDASQSNYLLIQTQGPMSEEQTAQLAGLGVAIHEYVPENTYVCGYAPSDLKPIRELPFVSWVNVYLEGFKVAPSLRPRTAQASASLLPIAVSRPFSRKPREVDVILHDDVDPSSGEIREQIATAARLDPTSLQMGRRKVRLTVQEGKLDALAALDHVHHIEEVPTRQLFNNVARPILGADVVVNGTAYQGEGEVVAVADTGFDKGSSKDVHPAFTGRVAKLYALGRTSPDRADDPDGHGTHVAGSVLGDGSSSKMGGPIQGTAPKAKLVVQSTLDAGDGLGGIPTDLHELFEPPYEDDGARVHTNSWGSEAPGGAYDASADEIDDVVWSHPDLVICFAAGNDGTDADANGLVDGGSIGSQSAAKNCITVGASESERPRFGLKYGAWPAFPANPLHSDLMADHPEGMAAFSSRGPTRERRIKPDVVAPGTSILSTLSRAVSKPSTFFGKSSDPLYFFDTGTSMATPLVAGCTAVLRETLVKNGITKPSAALVKALLINGAVELIGQYSPSEAGLSPNYNSGFGRVNLANSVIIPGPHPNSGLTEGGPLKQGGEDKSVIQIPEGRSRHEAGDAGEGDAPAGASTGLTLKVTLVWSDPPGAALQNDLDLIVRTPGGHERHGNMGANTEGFDRTNNVEQIVWENIPPGRAEIIVRAHRITRFPQPYAYAWRIS